MQWELKSLQIKGFPFVSCELVLFFVAAFKGKDMNRGPYQ